MQFADDMLAKDPNNTFYLYVKGYLYHNMKDYDKAIEFYKKTIEVDPNYAEAYSNLGLIYCLQAQDFSEKATTDINDPKYKEDQATLKTFYEKAKPYYEKVAEMLLAKNEPRYNSALIECYSYLGYYYLLKSDYPVSKEYWNKILAIDPTNATAKKALDGIK
mgnify:CR=1 FL=1